MCRPTAGCIDTDPPVGRRTFGQSDKPTSRSRMCTTRCGSSSLKSAVCRRFLKNCLNARYLCTSWSVGVRRVLANIDYMADKTVVNARTSDQNQLAVPKLES